MTRLFTGASALLTAARGAIWLLAAALLALPGATPAAAQPQLFPTFSVRAGGFAVSNGTNIRLDADAGDAIGTEIDFEKELGLDNEVSLATVQIEWLPGERHQFRAAYFRTSRDGQRTLVDREIEWGGQTYPVGAELSGEFTSSYYEVDWTWWMYKQERAGFGPTLGVMVLDLSAAVAARFEIGPIDVALRREASATAPVPTIGLEGRGSILPRLFLQGYIRFLPDVSIENISGDAVQYNAAIEWMPIDHAGLGFAYHGFGINAEIDESSYNGGLDLKTDGFQLYGKFSW
jgi:hypothetical protein